MTRFLAFLVLSLIALPALPAQAAGDFGVWLQGLRQEAISKGISPETAQTALADIKPLARVIELDRKQPESRLSFATYRKKIVNQRRIEEGRRLYREHRSLLDKTARTYGVPAPYIVALWGIETNFGQNTGGFDVIEALATLAYDGRRSAFFRDELIKALRIIDEGHISHARMRGSWAGAMGQNQFMPSSFFLFAVDGNDDGRRDIWGSLPDVFASTANYLGKSGWDASMRWGREVALPKGFSGEHMGLETRKSLSAWQKLGVRLPGGGNLPMDSDVSASIVRPDKNAGPAYMVYDNYRVIMKWNRSTYFATSVGLLADAIASGT